MVFIYIAGALGVIGYHFLSIPHALKLIFVGAFTPMADTGGFVGSMVRQSIRYGIAHAASIPTRRE